jgi:hypothetical protein
VDGVSVGTGTCASTSSTTQTCTLTYDPSLLTVGTHTLLGIIAADANYEQTASTVTNNLTVTQAATASTTQGLTAFPDTPFGSTSSPVTVTFTFQSPGTMTAPKVLTIGATGLDFTDAGTGTCSTNGTAHVYAAGDTCTVNVVFQPTAVGYRYGAVVLSTAGEATASVANLAGNGTGPQLLYTGTVTPTTIASFADGDTDLAGGEIGGPANGMVIDGKGDLLFSDAVDNTIKMLTATNGVIAAGTPITTLLSGLHYPQAMAIDGAGNLYVVDSGAGAIREFLATNGVLSSNSTMVTLQDGLIDLYGVGVDSGGNVFYAAVSGDNYVLYKLAAVNGVVLPNTAPTVIVSNIVIGYYSGVAFNIRVDGSGNLYVMSNIGAIEYYATNGSVQPNPSSYVFGESDIFATSLGFYDAAIMPSGDVFFANLEVIYHYEIGFGPDNESEVQFSSEQNVSAIVTDGHGHLYAEFAPVLNAIVFPPEQPITTTIQEFDLTVPPTLTFGPTQVGMTSAPQVFTIQNEGNEDLSLNEGPTGLFGVTSTGFTPGIVDCYNVDSGGDPPAGGCYVYVYFDPVAGQSGTINGTDTIGDDSLNVANATQTIPLVGTASPASAPAPTVITTYNYGAAVKQPAGIYANVTSNTPGTISGTVTFYDNGVAIPGGSAPLVAGAVSVSVGPLSVGTHPITATFTPANGSTFAASTSTVVPLIVYPISATIYLNNVLFVYDGTPKAVTATTVPAGLAYSVTYDGSPTPPSAVGSYRVIATITDPNYSGTATGTLTISKTATTATITLGGLNATYTGEPNTVTATTNPAGLSVSLTVGGLLNFAPQNAGYYPVTAEVTTPGYTGFATGELIVAPAPATVTLSNLSQLYTGSPIYPTVTTVPADLDYTGTFNGSLNAPVNPGVYTVVITVAASNYAGTATGTLTIAVPDGIWVLNADGTLAKLDETGATVASGIGTSGTAATNGGVAFDSSGNVWAVDNAATSVFMTNAAGSSSTSATGGGVNAPSAVAVDGAGYIWVANQTGNTVSAFTNAGQPQSPAGGYGSSYVTGDKLNAPSAIVIDSTGGVWVANKTGNSVTHIFGAAAPVVTPVSSATTAGTLGTKP